jgi:hypothetical protein
MLYILTEISDFMMADFKQQRVRVSVQTFRQNSGSMQLETHEWRKTAFGDNTVGRIQISQRFSGSKLGENFGQGS